jgi:hypothetical protein
MSLVTIRTEKLVSFYTQTERNKSMEIKNKTQPDPVADLHMADAYMRWQLMAAEEVVGKPGLATVLRENGLEKFIDNYPPEQFNFNTKVTAAEYAAVSAALMTFYGRAGRGMTLRIGRLGCKMAIEKQGALFNVAGSLALKMLPAAAQIKICRTASVNWENPSGKTISFRLKTEVTQWPISPKPAQCAPGNRPMQPSAPFLPVIWKKASAG